MAGCGLSGAHTARAFAVRAEAYDLSRMRHRHTANDQADDLANLERGERADAARSTMRFGNEGNRVLRPNMSPIVSLRARNNFTIFALRRVRSMVTPLLRRKSGRGRVHW